MDAAAAGVSRGTQGGSPEAFDALKKAYAVLSDDDRRAVYDERLPPASVVRPKVRENAAAATRAQQRSCAEVLSVLLGRSHTVGASEYDLKAYEARMRGWGGKAGVSTRVRPAVTLRVSGGTRLPERISR